MNEQEEQDSTDPQPLAEELLVQQAVVAASPSQEIDYIEQFPSAFFDYALKYLQAQVQHSGDDLRKQAGWDSASVTDLGTNQRKPSQSFCCIASPLEREPMDDNLAEELMQLLCIARVRLGHTLDLIPVIFLSYRHYHPSLQIPFDHQDDTHQRILLTVHYELTKQRIQVSAGKHWEHIGFLGPDPAQELRSAGMLGAITLLHLVACDQVFVQRMYSSSLKRDFPFCVSILHLLLVALARLKDGTLNVLCNATKSVVQVLNDMVVALAREFLSIWEKRNCTQNDFHEVMDRRIESQASKKQWKKLLQTHHKMRQLERIPKQKQT